MEPPIGNAIGRIFDLQIDVERNMQDLPTLLRRLATSITTAPRQREFIVTDCRGRAIGVATLSSPIIPES